ncbi:MAG: hypothetical protein A3E82_05915 [Gammaproteobacteria bacterium RIFCSPHIGHO2_12_FULL_38_11]|nr:MAG: hypothetical protein A3E82_05915 [Gammaproteobacteria bacterium RIFCSPHIGHO2_12_FULL_38_11]
MPAKSISSKTILAITIAIISWSSSFIFIRVSLQSYSPGELALFRYLIVSVVMLIFYFRLKVRHKPTLTEALQLFFLGFFGIGIYMVTLNYGELTVSASITSFIISMNPVVSILWAALFLSEKISFKRWIGIAISIIGVFIIAANELHHATFNEGMLMLFIAVLCAGMYNVGQKPLLKKFHPIEVAAISAWSGTLVMLIFTPSLIHAIPHATVYTTTSVIYLGVVPGAIGYLAWSVAMSSETPISKTILTLYTLPLFSTLLGWMILGEMPAISALIGGCIALLGALVATRY